MLSASPRSQALAMSLRACWLAAIGLVFMASASVTHAQEPQAPSNPLTAWLDLRSAPSNAPAQNVPSWVEACEYFTRKARSAAASANGMLGANTFSPSPAEGARAAAPAVGHGATANQENAPAQKSIFRIRLHKPDASINDLQLRLLFDDRPAAGSKLRVTAWDELGNEMLRSEALGQGLDLPSSETLTVPMQGVNYLEIEAPGDGSQVRGAFLTWLKKVKVRQPADFPAEMSASEPFHIAPAAPATQNDSYAYGVVTARIQGPPIKLSAPDAASVALQFELERQPLVAVVTFEALGASVLAPPQISVNERALGTADLHLPDLADPAYRGEAKEMDSQMSFRYAGWLRCQKVIPGTLLAGGLNNLTVALSEGSNPLAVRSVDIQLKYFWEKFDYGLTPALPPPVSSP